jgi:hypothetical protein
MKKYLITIAIISTLISCTNNINKKRDSEFCGLLKNIPKLEELNFNFENHTNYLDEKYLPISRIFFDSIFKSEAIIIDSSKFIGQFPLPFKRIGLVCYKKTYECDHVIDYVTLDIIEKCRLIKSFVLSCNDSEITIYNIRSRISKDFDTLFTSIEYSSEWVCGDLNPIDTLFTNKIEIDISSKNFDTLSNKIIIKKPYY